MLVENDHDLELCIQELQSHRMRAKIHNVNQDLLSKIDPKIISKINQVITISTKHNCSIGIVGGFVRDLLLGNPSDDVDFVLFKGDLNKLTEILAEKMQGKIGKMSNQTMTTQLRFPDGIVFEFNSTRKERYEYPSRIPIVEKASIAEDITRRDFTINALILFGSKYIDVFNGTEDLRNAVLRTTKNPATVFQEDYLRILRAIRFACKLDFKIENDVKVGIKKSVENLLDVPHERIIDELKLALGAQPVKAFQLMAELRILETLFSQMRNIEIDRGIFLVSSLWDKIELKLQYLYNQKINDTTVILASILSELQLDDVLEYSKQRTDYLRFQNIITLLKKYTFSNKEIKEIGQYIKNKDSLFGFIELSPSLLEMRLFLKEIGILLDNLIHLSLAENSTRKAPIFLSPLIEKLKQINEKQDLIHFVPELNGNEIEEIFGFKGREIGEVKLILSIAIMNEEISNTKEACEKYIKRKMFGEEEKE